MKKTEPEVGLSDEVLAELAKREEARQDEAQLRVDAALLIQGIDDPFLRPGIVPEENECGPLVERHFSPRGGHVGFLEGDFPGCAKPYFAGPPIDWLASKLKV